MDMRLNKLGLLLMVAAQHLREKREEGREIGSPETIDKIREEAVAVAFKLFAADPLPPQIGHPQTTGGNSRTMLRNYLSWERNNS